MKNYVDVGDWWLWTAAFLEYKKKGGHSKSAKLALKSVIITNPGVNQYFTEIQEPQSYKECVHLT